MPVAGDASIAPFARRRLPRIARTAKSCIKLGPDHRLDEVADPIAQPSFDRIKPVVKKINRRLRLRLDGIGLRGSARHGVVSCPARQRWTRSG
jgi:hypothetical protein